MEDVTERLRAKIERAEALMTELALSDSAESNMKHKASSFDQLMEIVKEQSEMLKKQSEVIRSLDFRLRQ